MFEDPTSFCAGCIGLKKHLDLDFVTEPAVSSLDPTINKGFQISTELTQTVSKKRAKYLNSLPELLSPVIQNRQFLLGTQILLLPPFLDSFSKILEKNCCRVFTQREIPIRYGGMILKQWPRRQTVALLTTSRLTKRHGCFRKHLSLIHVTQAHFGTLWEGMDVDHIHHCPALKGSS
ncbi:hypothetical protein TNCV_3477201 [Trichonephila clavipes]|nr:hypothetical protein TNCV_3477201 [Trichonephila clavipes]